MHFDPVLTVAVVVALVALSIGMALRHYQQPHVVAYLIVGVVIGPSALGIVEDRGTMEHLGALGVDILLFFIGMEVSPKMLIGRWRMAVVGTTLQIAASVAVAWGLGWALDWPIERIVLIGFVIAISSTVVVLKMLQDWGELDSEIGQNAISVLLAQDLAVIPMLIIINMMGAGAAQTSTLETLLQIVGAIGIGGLVAWITLAKKFRLPFAKYIRLDHEMQVFASLTICFGLSLITEMFGLSTALGAFVAGMVVAAARETDWVHRSLEPFRVVTVALFFISVGMMIDLSFLWENALTALFVTVVVFGINTGVNAAVSHFFAKTDSWLENLYFGALLAQIGEFSFALAAAGASKDIIGDYAYQMTVAVIALTLLFSPFYIARVKQELVKRGCDVCMNLEERQARRAAEEDFEENDEDCGCLEDTLRPLKTPTDNPAIDPATP
jgi:CPA2 family monovalent cation:H+ antiporter-2